MIQACFCLPIRTVSRKSVVFMFLCRKVSENVKIRGGNVFKNCKTKAFIFPEIGKNVSFFLHIEPHLRYRFHIFVL